MLVLILIALLTGVLTTIGVRQLADVSALSTTGKRIYAHLLEFRLFFDEPRLIWQAQLALLRENARLLRLLLVPTFVLGVPMAWLFLQLENVYGLRALRPGETAMITAQLTRPIEPSDRFALRVPGSIVAESPPVRVLQEGQVSWRIRAASVADGWVEVLVNGRAAGKAIASGESAKVLTPRRSSSLVGFVLHPEEARLSGGEIAWIEVSYPEGGKEWLFWFLGVSVAAALGGARWIPNRVN